MGAHPSVTVQFSGKYVLSLSVVCVVVVVCVDAVVLDLVAALPLQQTIAA
jgi:hypothetical protein